ncbi:transcriptional regulator, SarA/Rot family [Mammaliicoccus lentus]|uniref:transcriptional regulator, SarA/Rot family n=1 Tax=Mammaliicoccus lentus TaxID=42858 RepID=UPI003CFB0F25
MNKQINDLLRMNYVNSQVKKYLKKEFEINMYHLKTLKYMYNRKEQSSFTTGELKALLNINQTMLTHVISYLEDLDYYEKQRAKDDERKILIIVETRHRIKIETLIHQVTKDLKTLLIERYDTINTNQIIEVTLYINDQLVSIKKDIVEGYRLSMDQLMLLILIQQYQNEVCTLKAIKLKFNWDMVKINKAVKALVKLNYVMKYRNEQDERMVLVSIKKSAEEEVNKIINKLFILNTFDYRGRDKAMIK